MRPLAQFVNYRRPRTQTWTKYCIAWQQAQVRTVMAYHLRSREPKP
jgi:hypothetical protein